MKMNDELCEQEQNRVSKKFEDLLKVFCESRGIPCQIEHATVETQEKNQSFASMVRPRVERGVCRYLPYIPRTDCRCAAARHQALSLNFGS